MARPEMTSRERVRTAISRREPDRVPAFDSPWAATTQRWYQEGLPAGTDPREYFDFDIVQLTADLSPRFPTRVVEVTDEFIVEDHAWGGRWRNRRDYASTPEFLSYPVTRKEDWPAIRERLHCDHKRVDWVSMRLAYERARDRGKYVAFLGFAGNSTVESYLGMELSLQAMAEDPEWYLDMIETCSGLLRDTVLMLHREGFEFDAVWVANDMGYRNGPLFSPAMYRELQGPSERARNAVFHELGMQTIMHNDGCIKTLIPDIIANGWDCLQPLEVKAGMDLCELKREFGDRIALFGGIDARAMADPDPARIEAEIRDKLVVAKPGGGYLFHSDHSLPPDISLERFRFIMDCLRAYGSYE